MSQAQSLTKPWLVAVCPAMGNVAISAGLYLMAKLEMHLFAEFSARELFDLNHVEVKGGLIRPGGLPQSRCFVWKDPWKKRDIIVFIGEAQPLLEDGHIGGLNGELPGAAAESGLRGTCLLGEIPNLFAQLPFPKAPLAVREIFKTIADIQLSKRNRIARKPTN